MKKRVQYLISEIPGMELVLSSGKAINIPMHTHISSHVVLFVRSGFIRIDTASGVRSLQAGECLQLPLNSPHCLEASSTYTMLSLCLDATTFSAGDPHISLALAAMAAEGHICELECNSLLKALGGIPTMTEEPNDAVHDLKEYLVANSDKEMNLGDMAALAHVSKYHLIRVFKHRYGLTPHTFLAQNRVRKARQKLSDSFSMTQTALSAGFYDQSHFIRHFKRLYGLTPRQYLGSRKFLSSFQHIQRSGGMNLANKNNPSSPASTE